MDPIEEIMKDVDSNKDGKITEDEFRMFMDHEIKKKQERIMKEFDEKLKRKEQEMWSKFEMVAGDKKYVTREDLEKYKDKL